MMLRGVCLIRPQEIDWLFRDPSAPGGACMSNLRSLLGNNGVTRSTQEFRNDIEFAVPTIQLAANGVDERSLLATRTTAEIFLKQWQEFNKGGNTVNVEVPLQQTIPSMNWTRSRNPRKALQRYCHTILGSNPIICLAAVKL